MIDMNSIRISVTVFENDQNYLISILLQKIDKKNNVSFGSETSKMRLFSENFQHCAWKL